MIRTGNGLEIQEIILTSRNKVHFVSTGAVNRNASALVIK
jgi:hypothetical protein